MPSRPQYVSGLTGRRAYFRFLYGSHYWFPITDGSWTRGMVRDSPRVSIPQGGLYDSTDFLLHQPGIAQKRGGTTYLSLHPSGGVGIGISPPTHAGYLPASNYAAAIAWAPFPGNPELVVIGDDATVSAIPLVDGQFTTTVKNFAGAPTAYATKDKPKFVIGGSKNHLVITSNDGSGLPHVYNGSTVGSLGGSPPKGIYAEVYKSRLVLGNIPANENRLFFSPTPDITASWDTSESWIDCDHAITGLAALQNVLLIFSSSNTERIIGSTPPPGSDMDRAPILGVGCTDARSITVQDGNVFFANPRGVYYTNGAGVQSLTALGGIESYWQGLFSGYDPGTWTISTGLYGSFLYATVLDSTGTLVDALCCYLPGKAWWRNTNTAAVMYAAAHGAKEDLYYADRTAPRIVQMSDTFHPAASNKNDANGLPVQPTIEFRPAGYSPSAKRFGNGMLTYDLRDAATDKPKLALTVKTGAEADVSLTPSASPLAATSTTERRRFLLGRESQALTVRATQTGPSSKTEIYMLEVEQRQMPYGDLDSPA